MLSPLPFGRLLGRMLSELERKGTIFDLPKRSFFPGAPGKDLSVRFHGRRASTPLGPAAGPHSQMAQNIVLSWLGGSRIVELKTVQILDELKIPVPCIDMRNVGFNVEWSQELKLEQSLEEYVKASMLIEILRASGVAPLEEGFGDVLFDMSVGYDLKGIQSDRVRTFMRGMRDAREVVDRLREEIPAEHKRLRDLDFKTALSDTLTLSTFHGCPPEEIEDIIEFLLKEQKLNCVIKLNPTLLGPRELRRLMRDVMGYTQYRTPDSAFTGDASWDAAVGFSERLAALAKREGLGFGVKFNNTLIVENREGFLPASEGLMYLSGRPLHVIAMSLVRRFRGHFKDAIPISFSAGIDRANFADAVSLGLVPVTVCSDLLKPGGYGRQRGYFDELVKRMDAAGAANIEEFILKVRGNAAAALARAGLKKESAPGTEDHARWVSEAKLLNTEAYVEEAVNDPRYRQARNEALPKKTGGSLSLFDCLTCDKCIPVCPNDANFSYPLPAMEIPVVKLRKEGSVWKRREEKPLKLAKKHQLANFESFCNECGNCDPFCPEDGGPYKVKPRFFATLDAWRKAPGRDGFFLERDGARERVFGRFEGKEFFATVDSGKVEYSGEGFRLTFRESSPEETVEGEVSGEVDMTYFRLMNVIRKAVLDDEAVNYLN